MALRVAVIGAGPSGLCALRHLANDTEQFDPTCFERLDVEGGLWNYSNKTGNDKYGYPLPYAIHESLITNLPRQVMSFSGHDYAPDTPTFIPHATVKRYIAEYAAKFELKRYIKFETMVTSVKPVGTKEQQSWSLTIRDLKTENMSTSVFDAVIVCSGQNQFPFSADLPGLTQFQGQRIHSKDYRGPDEALNKNVLVLGAFVSAWEIIDDIRGFAKNIYVVRRRPSLVDMDTIEGVENVKVIRAVLPNSIELENGDQKEIDIIYLATGYVYKFPFLDPECGLETKNERLTPLYRHMIHIKYPSLIFIGYVKRALQLPLTELQVLYACALLKRQFQLPPKDEMLRWEEQDYQKRTVSQGFPDGWTQVMYGAALNEYFDETEQEAGIEFVTESIKSISMLICDLYVNQFTCLKKHEFKQVNGEWLAELKD